MNEVSDDAIRLLPRVDLPCFILLINNERAIRRRDAQGLRFPGLMNNTETYREEGPNFRSHLPVSMDGTCNGYQHLSAMGRDPIGGRATNLVPADEPEDIYQEVAYHVSIRIMFDAEYGSGREARGRREAQARQRA